MVLGCGDTRRDAVRTGASASLASTADASDSGAPSAPTPSSDSEEVSGCKLPRPDGAELKALQAGMAPLGSASKLLGGKEPLNPVAADIWSTYRELAADIGPWTATPVDLRRTDLRAVRDESLERTRHLFQADGWPAKGRWTSYRNVPPGARMGDTIRSTYTIHLHYGMVREAQMTRYETANVDVFRVAAGSSPLRYAQLRRWQPTDEIMSSSLRLRALDEDEGSLSGGPSTFFGREGQLAKDDMFFSTFVRFEQIDLAPCNYTRIDGFFLHGEAWYIVYKRGLTPTGELAPPRDASRWFEGHADG